MVTEQPSPICLIRIKPFLNSILAADSLLFLCFAFHFYNQISHLFSGRLRVLPFKDTTPSMLIPLGSKLRPEFALVDLNRIVSFVEEMKKEVTILHMLSFCYI